MQNGINLARPGADRCVAPGFQSLAAIAAPADLGPPWMTVHRREPGR
jgi:hypothetical protein